MILLFVNFNVLELTVNSNCLPGSVRAGGGLTVITRPPTWTSLGLPTPEVLLWLASGLSLRCRISVPQGVAAPARSALRTKVDSSHTGWECGLGEAPEPPQHCPPRTSHIRGSPFLSLWLPSHSGTSTQKGGVRTHPSHRPASPTSAPFSVPSLSCWCGLPASSLQLTPASCGDILLPPVSKAVLMEWLPGKRSFLEEKWKTPPFNICKLLF